MKHLCHSSPTSFFSYVSPKHLLFGRRGSVWQSWVLSQDLMWWKQFCFFLLCFYLSFSFLSGEPLEVKKLDNKQHHCWDPLTKWYNMKAQWYQACQMFISDHATKENPQLLKSYAASLREAGAWIFQMFPSGKGFLSTLKVTAFLSLSCFSSTVKRIIGVCCSLQVVQCVLRS